MNDHDLTETLAFATQSIRAGSFRSDQREHSEAIYLSSSFVYDSAAHAQAVFAGDEPGNVYSRYTNPSVQMLEARMAVLEGSEVDDDITACATASGMAAILGTCMSLLKSGDHVVCSRNVFGTTFTVFARYFAKFGVRTTFVDLVDYQQWQEAMTPQTRLLFLETPSNPLSDVADLERLADIAHSNDALLMVDNCFCTPALQRPLSFGADLVVHSATKYIDGQGRCLGGMVVGRKQLVDEVHLWQRSAGATMSPFNAWVFYKGLETLSVRMDAHCRNASELALWLSQHPAVERVHYSGLNSHPGHELAKKQQKGSGGVLAFEVSGGRESAWKVIDSVQIMSRTANLGDTRTTITHPATTTHCRLSDEDKIKSGITESLVRVAVGLENIDDLKADLEKGLRHLL
ncbi:O-succinylhomoserine sulfhydrylase [Endozoicomonas sp. GU-1]|uniref:O-succinylhomoserine sulfhydrylase n=1 Tax=Endozoicomonas sp. GU-1 TaxID=3009078 RepID=UPI0022B5809C|nr:O-succinylhomoserine sulfhydrylase [Endozoicomonas sp. GU-1]WBA79625.1 O-succinylhomoserine sulfhydrylase [Endozoicomonas sp. GU-1]WBA87207.1 O-succinylhomoserine sulfhydrylase [Endozoicomonas sp. GU-1]